MSGRTMTIFLGLSLAIIICWLLMVLRFVFLPAVLAMFIAVLLTPLVDWLTRLKMPRTLAALLTIFATMLIVYLVGIILLTNLAAFTDEFPKYEVRFQEMVAKSKELSRLEIGPLDNARLREELNRFSLSGIVGSTLNSIFSLLMYALFTFVFLIYFIFGSPKMPHRIRRAFAPERAAMINDSITRISRQAQQYILAKTVTSVITGGMVIIVCLLFRIDFPVTWGFFTFLLNFVPTIGVAIASLMPTVLALLQFSGWATAFWVLMVLTVIFFALGNLIEPKILGDSVNLSPLVALFALIFWGWLWGAAGMIIAVPLTAMIKFTFEHIEGLRPLGVLMGGEK